MTNTHKLLTLALGAMILFAACGKEDDKPSTPTDPVPDGVKKSSIGNNLTTKPTGPQRGEVLATTSSRGTTAC